MTGTTVGVQAVGEVPGFPVHVHVQGIKTRSPLREGLCEHLTNGVKQAGDPATRESPRFGCRVNPSHPQRFVRIDISNPAHERLVQQGGFDGLFFAGQRGANLPLTEGLLERIGCDMNDLRGDRGFVGVHVKGIDGEGSEETLVGEVEPKESVGGRFEPQSNAHVSRIILVGRSKEELPTHAEVSEQYVLATGDRDPHELTPSLRLKQARATKVRLKVRGNVGNKQIMSRPVTLQGPRIENVDRLDDGTVNRPGESTPNDLDLGKFRHPSP